MSEKDDFEDESIDEDRAPVKQLKVPELLELREKYMAAVGEIEEGVKRLHDLDNVFGIHVNVDDKNVKCDREAARKEVDRCFWNHLVSQTELASVMSSKEKNKLFQTFHDNPPPFVEKDVLIFVENYSGFYVENAANMAKEVYFSMIGQTYNGDAEVSWKKDNLQKVERTSRVYGGISYDAIFGHFSYDWWNTRRNSVNYDDLLRVCRLLDDKSPGYGFEFKEIAQVCLFAEKEVYTDYFKVTPYMNGNNKITWTRLDILSKFNKLCGNGSLPDAFRKRYKRSHFAANELAILDLDAAIRRYDRPRDEREGFHETPAGLSKVMVELSDPSTGDRYLEPSAGTGALLKEIVAQRASGMAITAIEFNKARWTTLKENYSGQNAVSISEISDFVGAVLAGAIPEGSYDKIVMNPPFERLNAIAHVLAAWKCLATRGRLVALMPASIMYRTDSSFGFFKDFLRTHGEKLREPYGHQARFLKDTVGGFCLAVANGLFTTTDFGCCIIKLRKD